MNINEQYLHERRVQGVKAKAHSPHHLWGDELPLVADQKQEESPYLSIYLWRTVGVSRFTGYEKSDLEK